MAGKSPYLMYQMANELEEAHLRDTSYMDSSYLGMFRSVMTEDLCPDLIAETDFFSKNLTACRSFTYGIS